MELELGLALLPFNQEEYSKGRLDLDLDLNNPTEVMNAGGKKRDFSEAINKRLVGWPPIKSTRKISNGGGCCGSNNVIGNPDDNNNNVRGRKNKLVKVKMDGFAIGRKVDISLHNSYHSLLLALDHMFGPNPHVDEEEVDDNIGVVGEVKVDFGCDVEDHHHCVVAYEDGEDDWMLVGDVPWETFAGSVKRLKIMSKKQV